MPNDGVLYQIRQRIDYEALFAEHLQMRGHGTWRDAFCIFHRNINTEALRVNVEEGYYRCHNPECGARGDFVDFFMRVRSLTFPAAVEELARRCGVEIERDASRGDSGVIDEAIVESAHERLMASPALVEFLDQRRGLNPDTIRRFQLGHDGQRFFIPIRDEVGRCVNIRRYKPDAQGADKMISWRAGYGSARIWPFSSIEQAAIEDKDLRIFEGELDAILAIQNGIAAVTCTGGAGTWREPWNSLFRGRRVDICYDADAAGRTGAAAVASHLYGDAQRIRLVSIPLDQPPGADFTDYVHGTGHSIEDFEALAAATPIYEPATDESSEELSLGDSRAEPERIHLSVASKAEYHNAAIRVAVMVSGKTTAPYIVPHRVRMECVMPGLPMCERCSVMDNAGNVEKELSFNSNEILQFINVNDQTVDKQLRRKMGVPQKCSYVQTEYKTSRNIEEIQVIPDVDRTFGEEGNYVTSLAYFIGHGLQANLSYLMTGHTVNEPKRQLATHLLHTAIPSQSSIDAFRINDEVTERLRAFNPSGTTPNALWEKLDEVYTDMERHVRIYERRDLLLACDLVFHSVIGFRFQGEAVERGWTEALILGDSRTGKSTATKRLLDFYGAGEMASGENTSIAGLVGGLHQVGTSWALRWGRIPLNDRRLLVIDEAGSLPVEHIERMSSIRSSGVAEIIKVHTERTNARTRQIWISNPRSPRPLSSWSQGVLAVKELIGKPEDIARFDMVVTAASGDVRLSTINAARAEDGDPMVYTSDLCHQRVMWAWSRSSEQITFQEEAITKILFRATQQGELYRFTTEIPLVEPNEQRVKLARLSVAAACLFFSTDDGETVIVRPEHVDFAWEFLERLYNKPSLAFTEYANIMRREHSISNSAVVREIIGTDSGRAIELMQEELFSQAALGQILDIDDRDDVQRAVKKLSRYGFLRRRSARGYYIKTPAAIKMLREIISGSGHGFSGGLARQEEILEPDGGETPPW